MSKLLLTMPQLQNRWHCPYGRVRETLARERIPIIALSGTSTYRIAESEILKLEKKLCHLKRKP